MGKYHMDWISLLSSSRIVMCLYAILDTTRAPDMYAAMQQNVLGHAGDRAKCPPTETTKLYLTGDYLTLLQF